MTQQSRTPAPPATAKLLTEASTRPAHWRLSRDTWNIIMEEYRQGATAPELADRWRVSIHAVRRRITQHGATKRDWGDQMAREGVEARTSALAAARVAAEAEAKRNHLTPPVEDGWSGAAATNAPTLSRRALCGVARALDQGRLEEAKALGALAASLARIPERPGDRVDWDDVVEALLDKDKALLLVAAEDDGPMHPARARYLRAVVDQGMKLGRGPHKAAQVRLAKTILELGEAMGNLGLPTWMTPSGDIADLKRQAEGYVEDEN